MFARVLGPFFFIVCMTAAVRAAEMPALMADFGANASWSWMTGSFVLIGGLVVIAFQPRWRSPAAIMVSILGWLVAVRGLLLLAFPTAFISMANSVIGLGALWIVMCNGFASIGLYLTLVGWLPLSSRSAWQSGGTVLDLPRAA